MKRIPKSTVGRKQPVHKQRVVLPLRNFLLEGLKVTAIQIEFKQTTRHQMKQTWSRHRGPERRFRSVHRHGRLRRTRSFHIKCLTILSEPQSHILRICGRLRRRDRCLRRINLRLWCWSRRGQDSNPFRGGAACLDRRNLEGLRRRSLVDTTRTCMPRPLCRVRRLALTSTMLGWRCVGSLELPAGVKYSVALAHRSARAFLRPTEWHFRLIVTFIVKVNDIS